MVTNSELKAEVIVIEKQIAALIGRRVELLEKQGGEFLTTELTLSVASLLSSRIIAHTHELTGESAEKIMNRFFESVRAQVPPTLAKYAAKSGRSRAFANGILPRGEG